MPTFREDLHLGHSVPMTDTDDIVNHAITEEKLADGSVSTRTIQDRAVTEPKLADDAVSTRTIQDKAVTAVKLGFDVIPVLIQPLIDEIQYQINSLEIAGLALTNHLGQNEYIGISQRYLTELFTDIQDQLDALTANKATFTLSASKSLVFVGGTDNVTLTLSSSEDATDLKIKTNGGDVLAEKASGRSLSFIVSASTFNTAPGTTTYRSEAYIKGNKKTASCSVTSVGRIYYGAGTTSDAAINTVGSPKTSPSGTYNITVPAGGGYLWWKVPASMSITKISMSGFDVPMNAFENIAVNELSYKLYRSSNSYQAGSLTVVMGG